MSGMASIEEIQMQCFSSVYNHGVFYNAKIYVCHTPLSELTDVFEDNYAGNTPELTFSDDTLDLNWTDNQWEGHVFDTPFSYNGTDNLVFEFRWQGDDGNYVYVQSWLPSSDNRVLRGDLTSPTGTLLNEMNSLRIYYTPIGIDETIPPTIPKVSSLRNYPDPFSSMVTISYQLHRSSCVSLCIYNITGQLIKTLIYGTRGSGYHSIKWDGNDEQGKAAGSGIFFCRLETDNSVLMKKIISIR